MYPNLKSIGVVNQGDIERYKLIQEADNDILKIYFRKDPGHLFAKSMKFKFPRQRKKVIADYGSHDFRNISEINSNLREIVKELDNITVNVQHDKDVKLQIRDDLKYLESVVASKIKEIEHKLQKM